MRKKYIYSIRKRFLTVIVLSTLPFFLLLSTSYYIFYIQTQDYIEKQIENSTQSLHQLIEIELDTGIRTYLRAKVEMAEDVIRQYIEIHPKARLAGTPESRILLKELLSFKVGKSGYFYALDSAGKVIFHPDSAIVGQILKNTEPMTSQLANRAGYMEYLWKNSSEDQPKEKALYMTYVPELDWILTATSYQQEFTSIIDMETLTRAVLSITPGKSGYSYIINRSGLQIAYPDLSGRKTEGMISPAEYKNMVQQMFRQKEGYFTYHWRNPPERKFIRETVYIRYLPDFDWIVGTAIFKSEMEGPAKILISAFLMCAFILAITLLIVIYRINRDIEVQLGRILAGLAAAKEGDLSSRIRIDGPSETREIAQSMNNFMQSLEQKAQELQYLNESLRSRVDEQSEALKKSTDKLIEAEKQALTSRLVAGIAHEINTPIGVALTAITHKQGLADKILVNLENNEIRKSDLDAYLAKSSESLEIAVRNLVRAGDLVKSFKNISADQLSLEERQVDLKDVVDEILLSLRPMLKNRKIVIERDIPAIQLITFPGVIVHLLINLITNSLDHGFDQDTSGTISIAAQKTEKTILLEYSDNGKGIPSSIIDYIFNPFYTTRREKGNTGIGLNIVQNMVKEKLHGTISVESEPGEYTRFTVRFPLIVRPGTAVRES